MNLTRRGLSQLLLGSALAGAGAPAFAQSRKDVLVIGLDIGDTVTLDPAKQNNYSPPLTLEAAYDTLVTLAPGQYTRPQPMLATSWARTPDGQGWRFTLRKDVKFYSGNPMTADDVKWTFDRIFAVKDQTAFYIGNVSSVNVVDDHTVDILLKTPSEPILDILAAPGFGILDRKTVMEHGGTTDANDKATEWLNTHTAGTGAYAVTGWARNSQLQLARNPNSWRGQSAYARIVIRHIPDSAAQLLAVQRGDVDVAFNLIPEQIASLKSDPKIRAEKLESLDFVYMALTQEAEFNKALAVKEARQAIMHAIDYDGIKNKLLGGEATRPATFLPVGVLGSTQADADKLAPKEDLAQAKQLLQKAGFPDGFEFELSYGQAVIDGVSYGTIAQKLQADLSRVGIQVKLNPMDQVNMRTQYVTGKTTAALTFWNPPAVNNYLWAGAATQRVAKRVHWTPSEQVLKLVRDATGEADRDKQAQLWIEFQKELVDQANLVVLFQPIYQVAVRDSVGTFPLTAAGWLADLSGAKP
ncbi:MAG: ABC transporter substrate-binding protein [Acetobacteraceae bacterium]|nr:ABC transporter substrate-binding protein [Acetobacteraceae bacterium]